MNSMSRIKSILLIAFIGLSISATAQKYMTQNGTISFHSKTPLEDIEAVNKQVSSVVDLETGNMAYSLLMKAFTFEKALMQEHFNEKYVESEKYPKATFKGQIQDIGSLDLTKGPAEVTVKGPLTLHGETKEIEAKGTLELKENVLTLHSTFQIEVADFNIKVPSAVKDNIAKTIEVKVDGKYEKLE